MSILGHSRNTVIEDAEMSSAGRDVRTTTQHANSAFTSSSDQTTVMEQPNVLNAGGNITYITWNFLRLKISVAALTELVSLFRTRASMAEPQRPQYAVSSTGSTGQNATSQEENAINSDSGLAELHIDVAKYPNYVEGTVIAIRKVGCVANKVYIESMIQLGLGYPMCNPQPQFDLPLDYRRIGISFGDLGIIDDDGDLDLLFNVLLRAKDPINIPADLPDEFDTPERPKVMARPWKLFDDASTLSNLTNIRTKSDPHSEDISLTCKDGAAGAILLLPNGASISDLKNKGHWKDFISKNALSWYKYARKNCGRALDRHSLYLITGHIKSKTWGQATFATTGASRDDVLVMGKSTAPKRPPYIWKDFGGASQRSGPIPDRELTDEFRDEDIENQSLFLRGFKISLSEQAWNELSNDDAIDITNKDSHSSEEWRNFNRDRNSSKGKGKDDSGSYTSFQGNLGNSVSLSNFPPRSIEVHPSNKINDLLLSLVPDARIAITHDSVWMDIVQSKESEYEKGEEMLAATFGSRFVASYCKDTGMCTFEPVKELIPMLMQAGSLSEDNVKLHESLAHMLNNWTSSDLVSVADCLEICTKVMLGNEQSETLAEMENLAQKSIEEGKWAESEDIQIQILEAQARTLGKEHANTLTSIRTLSLTYFHQRKWADAENLQTRVLETRTRILGKEHLETLVSMYDLAQTYHEQSKWADAENLQSQMLEISNRILGKEHPGTLTSMSELAVTYYEQGRYMDAENLQSQVLEMNTRILGKGHPDTVPSMHTLSLTYCQQDKWTDAEDLQCQVLKIRSRILGKEHPDTLASIYLLSVAYYKQGRYTDAEALQRQVLEIRTRILGKEHPNTVTSMHALSLTYCQQDKWTDAENLQSQVLKIRTRILGKEHPDTITSMHDLAATYHCQGKWTDAENFQTHVREMRTRILGEEHPDTITSMHNLAATYQKQGKWTEAENLHSQVLEIRTKILGIENLATVATMENLAMIYCSQRKWTDAENIQTRVVEMRTRILGKEHPDTLSSENLFTEIHNYRTQTRKAEISNSNVPKMTGQNAGNDRRGKSAWKKTNPFGRLLLRYTEDGDGEDGIQM